MLDAVVPSMVQFLAHVSQLSIIIETFNRHVLASVSLVPALIF